MMQRTRFVSIGSAAIAVLLAWFAATVAPVSAEIDTRQEMAVIVMESSSARQAQQTVPLTLSFISLMATLHEGGEVIFIDTDRPGEAIGPFQASDSDFDSSRSEIEARLGAERSVTAQSILEALEEARETLSGYGAPAGSTIYLMLGGGGDLGYDVLGNTASPLLNRIAEQRWTVHGLNLQTDDQNAVKFLDTVSRPTGGRVFSLASGADLKPLADYVFSRGSKGSLQEVAAQPLADSEVLSSDIAVMPGTEETTLFFFKEGRPGSFRLTNPSGKEVTPNDRSASHVIETENLVVWRLMDPVPGTWRVETKGVNGNISIWGHTTNRYDLVLRTLFPLPVGKPSSIMAYAAHEGRTAILEGTRMFAKIAGPDSSIKVYELFDDGTQGDSQAGDGYYTMTIPSLDLAGLYGVTLELLWTEFNHKITSNDTFEAQAFPSFHVEAVSVSELELREPTNVGIVSVHVDGGPYAVDPEAITAALVTPSSGRGTLELVPHRLYGDGPAWQYDIVFTPEEHGPHTLQFNLSLEYAGRMYNETSSSIAVSTVSPPPVPVVPAVVAEPAEAPAPVPVVPEPAPPQSTVAGIPAPPPQGWQFPWLVMIVLAAVALPLTAIVLFFMTRPKPYGYIYTEGDDKLVDFSKLERRPILRFFYRGLIRGSELNVPGFEGLVFHFMKDRIDVKSFGEHPTVRVNNQPLIDTATIGDKTWIGTGGKLYTFLNAPKPAPGPAGAD